MTPWTGSPDACTRRRTVRRVWWLHQVRIRRGQRSKKKEIRPSGTTAYLYDDNDRLEFSTLSGQRPVRLRRQRQHDKGRFEDVLIRSSRQAQIHYVGYHDSRLLLRWRRQPGSNRHGGPGSTRRQTSAWDINWPLPEIAHEQRSGNALKLSQRKRPHLNAGRRLHKLLLPPRRFGFDLKTSASGNGTRSGPTVTNPSERRRPR